ncbi:MAG: hypothetical protein WA731_02670 [Pseudonocardiaceae bacterium]|nr:hypothetical protein [Pseudonocardiaceae bacterium]
MALSRKRVASVLVPGSTWLPGVRGSRRWLATRRRARLGMGGVGEQRPPVANLFTFAQVSLLQAAVALRNSGIEVAVVNIPTVPA